LRALAFIPGSPAQLVIYPTGAGEARKVDRGPLEGYQSARWFADGARMLICGNEVGRAARCYVQDVSGGAPRPITPDDTRGGYPSPDGTQVLVRRGDAVAELYPIAGGPARAVPGLAKDDIVVRWNRNGRSVIVTRASLPAKAELVDVVTGARAPVKEIAPVHADGGIRFAITSVADDPAAFSYSVVQRMSRLFLVAGAR
jgi:hypothetical protein